MSLLEMGSSLTLNGPRDSPLNQEGIRWPDGHHCTIERQRSEPLILVQTTCGVVPTGTATSGRAPSPQDASGIHLRQESCGIGSEWARVAGKLSLSGAKLLGLIRP